MPTIFTRSTESNAATKSERQSRANRGFSLSRVIAAMTNEAGRLDGYELEVLQELSRAAGESYLDRQRIPLPVQLLVDPSIKPDRLLRLLNAGDVGSALAGADTMPVADLLRGFSVVAEAGVTMIDVPRKNGAADVVIPKTDGAMEWHWLGDETTALTQSDPTIGKVTLSPHAGGVFTKYSRLLARQGGVADALLQREMLGSIGRMLDNAVINGTGASGQPLGIVSYTGVNQVAASPLFYNEALDMEYNASLAGVRDEQIEFLVNPEDRNILKQRQTNTVGTAHLVVTDLPSGTDYIVGRRLRVSRDVPAGKLICGMWSDCVVGLWGVPMLEINPNDPTGFKKGTFEARVVIDTDVGLLHPEAWTVHTFDAP